MQFINSISNLKKTLFSFEILPPFMGDNIQNIFRLLEYNPVFISLTFHLEEFLYSIINTFYRNFGSKRPGTIAISSSIRKKLNIDIIPHLIGSVCNKQIIDNYLIDLNYLGLNTVFIIRGDIIKKYIYSLDIVKTVALSKTKFSIGVAGYPEKHFESPSLEDDIFYLKKKVLSGANYIITQMFFDNSKFFNFVSLCRSVGIEVPIIPSIKIITLKSQINTISYKFNLNIPKELLREIHHAKNNNIVKEIGIEWATNQSIELKKSGVPVIHYYTINRDDNLDKILKVVF